MKHERKSRGVILGFSLLILLTMMQQTEMAEANNIGESYTKTCRNHICTAVFESEPIRYKTSEGFFGDGTWTTMDENYNQSECIEEYDWCAVNKYALNLKDQYDVHIETKFVDDLFGYKLFGIEYGTFQVYFFPGNASINGSVATYNLTSDLKYEIQYLPSRVKDAVVIDRDGFFQSMPIAPTFDVWYEVTPGFSYNITNQTNNGNESDYNRIQVIKDGVVLYEISHIDILNGEHFVIEQTNLEIETFGDNTYFVTRINSTELINETSYPIYIDPQVEMDVGASYDAYIARFKMGLLLGYRRFANPINNLYVSTTKLGPREWYARDVIEFNLSAIPEDSIFIDGFLNITPKTVGDINVNRNLTLRHMKKDHTYFPNNVVGNSLFWADMGDGKEYANINLTTGMIGHVQSINLSMINATLTAQYFESYFNESSDLFGVGMRPVLEPPPTSTLGLSSFYPRSDAQTSLRPKLIIIYEEPSTDWQLAVVGGLAGAVGLMLFMHRKLRPEEKPLKDLLMLNSVLVGTAGIYVASAMAEDAGVSEMAVTTYQGALWLMTAVTFFYTIKFMSNVMEMMTKAR